MDVRMSEEETPAQATKRSRISQTDIPAISLEKALRVPRAIAENYASHPTRPLDVASALGVQPSSGGFRVECGAAIGCGLTEGGPNAPEISLTTLGKRITKPTEIEDDKLALRAAALKPTVADQFYEKYDGSPLPPKNIAQNVLATLTVPEDRTSDVYDLLIENARFVGLLKAIKDKEYIDIGGPLNSSSASTTSPVSVPTQDEVDVLAGHDESEADTSVQAPPHHRQQTLLRRTRTRSLWATVATKSRWSSWSRSSTSTASLIERPSTRRTGPVPSRKRWRRL